MASARFLCAFPLLVEFLFSSDLLISLDLSSRPSPHNEQLCRFLCVLYLCSRLPTVSLLLLTTLPKMPYWFPSPPCWPCFSDPLSFSRLPISKGQEGKDDSFAPNRVVVSVRERRAEQTPGLVYGCGCGCGCVVVCVKACGVRRRTAPQQNQERPRNPLLLPLPLSLLVSPCRCCCLVRAGFDRFLDE